MSTAPDSRYHSLGRYLASLHRESLYFLPRFDLTDHFGLTELMELFIPILLGSGRAGRRSEHAARFVYSQLQQYNACHTEFLDVVDFVGRGATEAMPEERATQWRGIMDAADGLIIVSPEYNHGYPGELKLMLDQLYAEYHRKPVGICGVSDGILGGVRMVESVRLVAIALGMIPTRSAVYFSKVENLFDEQGAIRDVAYKKRLTALFDELMGYAQVLKQESG